MDKDQIRSLLLTEIERRSGEAAEALAKFVANPGALSFRDAENTLHAQMAQALDAIVGQVAQAALDNAEAKDAGTGKKTAGAMGGGKSPSS